MSRQKLSSFALILLQSFLFVVLASSTPENFNDLSLKRFIISVRQPQFIKQEQTKEWHDSLLSPLTTIINKDAGDVLVPIPRLLHSYSDVLSGFSARLTDNELNTLSNMDWFINSIPDPIYKLHTTHSPKFLDLIPPTAGGGLLNRSNQGEGVIIGLLDTGIFPSHPSFSDDNLPSPPPKWKGSCHFDKPHCNNKLIGARSFITGEPNGTPPIDNEGHGTHTASTAAGAAVPKAAAFGNARGTAVGMAPRAHIAAYKVCSDDACYGSDIMAGMEAAIHDGVDVISASLGHDFPVDFVEDPMAISSFSAISKGIFVSASAGNNGPAQATVTNDAPWILTVAAGTMDRRIVADVKIGNGNIFKGESLNQKKDLKNFIPLVFPGDNGDEDAAACNNGSLAGFDVRGKAVVCRRGIIGRVTKGAVVKEAGAAAMILINAESNGYTTLADGHVLPVSHVNYEDGMNIINYIRTTENATANIYFHGTKLEAPFSPSIADFSSRGPSNVSPGILKPDIAGPGVNVLAAWSKNPTFNVISGTSMACPHLSGIAALIKAAHPRWSPAAIKSALLTTADVVDRTKNPISDEKRRQADIFSLGAGHVNPEKAMDPGLVYDLEQDDYFPYLCGLGYNESLISVVAKREIKCSEIGSIKEADLNYPTFSVEIGVGERLVLNRALTYVGEGDGSQRYRVDIEGLEGVIVRVVPNELRFKKVNGRRKFRIVLKRSGEGLGVSKGYLKWVSLKHVVRSAIVVNFK